jgi:predicted CoA-binding protein
MSDLNALVSEFLAQRSIAIVGVSDRRDTGANANYRRFKDAGYQVYAIHPRIKDFDGNPCYPDLRSLPAKPDAVFILASPGVTDQIVRECVELGIDHVWMHCMLGTKAGLGGGMTSVSPSSVRLCQEHGIKLIPGSCPNQFLNPDFGHMLMRRLWGVFGFMRMD